MALVNIKNIYLDFCVRDLVVINCTQYDKDSRTFCIHLLDKGKPYPMDGVNCQLAVKMHKKDDTLVFNDCDIDSDGNATLLLTEQMCKFDGIYDIQFMYIDKVSKEIIHTMPARIMIAKSVADNVTIESSDEFNTLNKMLLEIDDLIKGFNDNEQERIDNENQRIINENERIDNENQRQVNENTRIDNEEARTDEFIGLKNEAAQLFQDTRDAIYNAEIATDNANASSERAENATDAINELINNNTILFRTEKGTANGVAELDENGKVPSTQLPSYVDDVLEYSSLSEFPTTGEGGKIYVDLSTNKTYRWGGTEYVVISETIAIGTTTGTALDGKVGNDHILSKSNPHQVTKEQIGLGNVDNKSSSTIRSEITKQNVEDALGYTPSTMDLVTETSDGLMRKEDKVWVDSVYSNIVRDKDNQNIIILNDGNIKLETTTGKVYYNGNEVATTNDFSNLPYMIYMGTLGEGGDIPDLPKATSDNEGYTYKVITDGTYGALYHRGDVNGDGVINSDDFDTLMDILADPDKWDYYDKEADMDDDGFVNTIDVVYLSRYLQEHPETIIIPGIDVKVGDLVISDGSKWVVIPVGTFSDNKLNKAGDTMTGKLTISEGGIDVKGESSFDDDVTINDDLNVKGELDVQYSSRFNSSVTITEGNLVVNNDITADDITSATVTSDEIKSEEIYVNSLSSKDRSAIFIDDDVDLDEHASLTVGKNLTVGDEETSQNAIFYVDDFHVSADSFTYNSKEVATVDDIPTTLPASDVYDWAKQPNKPSYSASEVGAYTKSETDTAISTAIQGIPTPMSFKGTLGEGGTISTLPLATSENEGFVYKVITEGDYAVSGDPDSKNLFNERYVVFDGSIPDVMADIISADFIDLTSDYYHTISTHWNTDKFGAAIDIGVVKYNKDDIIIDTRSATSVGTYKFDRSGYGSYSSERATKCKLTFRTTNAYTSEKLGINDLYQTQLESGSNATEYQPAYSSVYADIGDIFISDGVSWVLVPSGDEPSGTVTNISMTVPTGLSVSGVPITSSGTLAVTYEEGYSIPSIAKQQEWDAKSEFSGDYNDLTNKPAIPQEVTETTVSNWGFTKNTGTYSKPEGGIPKSDLDSNVQSSLSKADSALQSFTETDPVFTASAAHGISSDDITNWNNKLDKTGGAVDSFTLQSAGTVAITTEGSSSLTYNGKQIATIEDIPTVGGEMNYIGTVGTGGTVTDLPTPSELNKGNVYKVITDGSYSSIPQSPNLFDSAIEQGSISGGGNPVAADDRVRATKTIRVKRGELIAVSWYYSGVPINSIGYSSYQLDGTFISDNSWNSANSLGNNRYYRTFMMGGSGDVLIRIYFRNESNNKIAPANISNVQVEYGSVTDYILPSKKQNAFVGDLFIGNVSEWVYIPSGLVKEINNDVTINGNTTINGELNIKDTLYLPGEVESEFNQVFIDAQNSLWLGYDNGNDVYLGGSDSTVSILGDDSESVVFSKDNDGNPELNVSDSLFKINSPSGVSLYGGYGSGIGITNEGGVDINASSNINISYADTSIDMDGNNINITSVAQDINIDTSDSANSNINLKTPSDGKVYYNDQEIATKKDIEDLPSPMIFKGSLGVGGTVETLPTATKANEGFTYKVITDGTYGGCYHRGDVNGDGIINNDDLVLLKEILADPDQWDYYNKEADMDEDGTVGLLDTVLLAKYLDENPVTVLSPAIEAKVGDTIISNGSQWILIPSGDEPSGTVTSVGMTVPTGLSVSGSPITSAGTIALSMANGYSIPTTAKQTEWDDKQSALTSTQMNAVNSGITSTKVNTYDGYAGSISAKYTKPSTGIPKSDLASDVQTSLGKADTALQSHQDISGKVDNTQTGANGLLTKLPTWTADPTDDTYLFRQDTSGSNEYGKIKFSTVWNYIKSKISSVLGLTATSYNGSAAKVNNHTVDADVPSNAKFTDTTYNKATSSNDGLMPKEDKAWVDNVKDNIEVTNGNLYLGDGNNLYITADEIYLPQEVESDQEDVYIDAGKRLHLGVDNSNDITLGSWDSTVYVLGDDDDSIKFEDSDVPTMSVEDGGLKISADQSLTLEAKHDSLDLYTDNEYKATYNGREIVSMSNGDIYQTDSTPTRTKTVPSSSASGSITMLGGMSRKSKQLIQTVNLQEYTFAGVNAKPILNSEGLLEYFLINGTCTETHWMRFNADNKLNVGYDGIATMSGFSSNLVGYARTNDGTFDTTASSKTFTRKIDYFQVLVASGATFNNYVLKPMLSAGSTATAYEPYTDHLIDAKVDKVVSYGKNLCTTESMQVSAVSKFITINNIKANADYTFSMDMTRIQGKTISNIYLWGIHTIEYFDKNNNLLLRQNGSVSSLESSQLNKYELNFVPPINTDYIVIDVGNYNDDTEINTLKANMQLELGNKTPFTPYREPISTPIPASIIAKCPDYGVGINNNCYNYIDMEEKKYYHNVGKVKLTDIGWERYSYWYQCRFWEAKAPSDNSVNLVALCSKYPIDKWSGSGDKTIAMSTNNYLGITDSDCPDLNSLLKAIEGHILYYELATKEVIDLSNVWEDFDILEVESDGEIAFNYPQLYDGFEVDMPNTVKYLKSSGKQYEETKYLLNNTSTIYPITTVDAVLDKDGKPIRGLIADGLEKKLDKSGGKLTGDLGVSTVYNADGDDMHLRSDNDIYLHGHYNENTHNDDSTIEMCDNISLSAKGGIQLNTSGSDIELNSEDDTYIGGDNLYIQTDYLYLPQEIESVYSDIYIDCADTIHIGEDRENNIILGHADSYVSMLGDRNEESVVIERRNMDSVISSTSLKIEADDMLKLEAKNNDIEINTDDSRNYKALYNGNEITTEEYFKLPNAISQTEQGTNIPPSGATHILDVAEIYGKSEQVQLSGKNLINAERKSGSSGYWVLNQYVYLGVGNYTISFKNANPNGQHSIACRGDDDTVIAITNSGTSKGFVSYTFTSPKAQNYKFNIYFNASYDCYDLQIEAGNTATDFEPFVVDNLLETTLPTTTKNGVTCTRNADGTYTLNGTATGSVQFTDFYLNQINENIHYQTGTTYKYTGAPTGVDTSKIFIGMRKDGAGSNIIDAGNGVIFNPQSTDYHAFVRVFTGLTLNNLVIKPMLTTKLSATYNDYIPYRTLPSPSPSFPQPIKSVSELEFKIVGKNKFTAKVESSVDASGTTTITNVYADSRPILSLNARMTQGSTPSTQGEYWNIIASSDTGKQVYSGAFTKQAKYNYIYIKHNGSSRDMGVFYDISNLENGKDYELSMRVADNRTNVVGGMVITDIQIERGTTRTEYESYKEDTHTIRLTKPLCSVGEYKDAIKVDEGVIERWIKHPTLTGNENWGMDSGGSWTGTSGNSFYIQNINIEGFGRANGISSIKAIICDKYIGVPRGDFGQYDNLVCIAGSGTQIEFVRTNYKTVAEWKNHVANANIQVNYILATPTTEPIPSDASDYLQSLEKLSADHTITVTDQEGRDCSYLVDYITSKSQYIDDLMDTGKDIADVNYKLSKKLDKTGGTIDGNITVNNITSNSLHSNSAVIDDSIRYNTDEIEIYSNKNSKIKVGDVSGIRILNNSGNMEEIKIGKTASGDDRGEISQGIEIDPKGVRIADTNGSDVLNLKSNNGSFINASSDLHIVAVGAGRISFDTASDANLEYLKATWKENLKQLDVELQKGVNFNAHDNSYYWVNAEKKAVYGNTLNKLEFRTDGVAKFSNEVTSSNTIQGKDLSVNGNVSMKYNATTESLDFIFN